MKAIGYTAATIILLLVLVFGTRACVQNQISDCTSRGGRAITSPWYSKQYTEVRCIEGVRP